MNAQEKNRGFVPVEELKYLFFDLNSYFASVEQQENSALIGKPVAIVPMISDSTCAIAASYEAKRYGIKTGTRIYEAKKLCPTLRCVLARHDVYIDYHERIFAELENHLHVSKICSVDEAACLLLGHERQHKHAIALAQQIKQGLHDNIGPAITCSIGIAPNAFLAKIASDIQKPDGLVVFEPKSYHKQLFGLKLRDLPGINTRMEERLNRAEVFSIEQFCNLAPKHARKVWGSVEGERFWYKLHGYDVPDTQTQKSVVGHSRVLDPAHRHPDKAYDITKQLVTKAAARLRRYNLYAKRIALRVRNTDRVLWANERSLSPTQDSFAFIKALDHLWHIMVRDLQRTPLFKTSITLYDLFEREQVTLDLFDTVEQGSKQNTALSKSIDNLNKRYGAGTINVGTCSKTQAGYVGTKIAFTRIPQKEEFRE